MPHRLGLLSLKKSGAPGTAEAASDRHYRRPRGVDSGAGIPLVSNLSLYSLEESVQFSGFVISLSLLTLFLEILRLVANAIRHGGFSSKGRKAQSTPERSSLPTAARDGQGRPGTAEGWRQGRRKGRKGRNKTYPTLQNHGGTARECQERIRNLSPHLSAGTNLKLCLDTPTRNRCAIAKTLIPNWSLNLGGRERAGVLYEFHVQLARPAGKDIVRPPR
jgi:hypothetical protein